MPQTGLRKTMILNTISNYGKLVLGIFITIFLTRLLFLGLPREEYGIWALLWSIFGYSLLLDFGFGAAIQKATSETKVNQDWEKFNRLITTVFINYIFMGILIALATIFMAKFLDQMFHFSSESDILYYRKIFIMFGCGTAIVFPFGFFVEVLRGLHRIRLRNFIQMIFTILNFIFMYIVIKSNLGLLGMTIVTITTTLLTNFAMAFYSYRKIPTLKIRLSFYDFKLLKKVMSFSLFAYIITFTNLIIYRTDQLVISVFASVTLVAVYQISSRLAMTFKQFSSQFLDNLAPVAASLFASKQKSKVAEILIQSNRLLGFVSTLMFVPLVIYVRPLLNIWLELDDPAGIKVAVVLLISMYIIVFFRSSSVNIMLMGKNYKRLSVVAIIECLANLGLSILLIRHLGILGVALGTLIPNFFIAIFFNIPIALKFSGITLKEYLQQSVIHSLWIGAVTFVFAYILYRIHYPETLLLLFAYSCATVILYLIMYYKFGTHGWEKKQLKEFIQTKLKRK